MSGGAINTAFHSERVHIEDSERLEHVCVKVTIGSSNIFLFAVYIRSVQETEKFMLFADIVKKNPYSESDSVIVLLRFENRNSMYDSVSRVFGSSILRQVDFDTST